MPHEITQYLEEASPLVCDVECDLCHKFIPAGTPCVCLPSHKDNSDPWGHVECVRDALVHTELDELDRFNNMQRRALRAEADRAVLLAAIAEAKYGAAATRNPSVVALYDAAAKIGATK